MNQNFHPAIICLRIDTIKQYCASCIEALLITSLIYLHVSMVYIFCTVIGDCSREILKMYFSQKSIVFLGFFGYSTGECQSAINTAVFQNRFAIHGYVYRMRFRQISLYNHCWCPNTWHLKSLKQSTNFKYSAGTHWGFIYICQHNLL